MAEYVCELVPDDHAVPYDSDDYSGECIRRERVVRCRDCAHYWEEDPWGNRDACSQGVVHTPHPRLVRPDGFCAWGKPREEGYVAFSIVPVYGDPEERGQ